MYRCKLCVAPVLQSQGRKQLASLTSASCVAALVDLACESGTAKTEATQTYASGYLCNKCFNSIAKYSGLKEELLYKLSKVYHSSSSASSSSGAGTSEISRQGMKRKADAALQGANAVKVVVTYNGCEKRYVLSPKRERIGKSLGRNFKRAFAQHSLESQEMGKHLLARIHKMIRVEMKNVLKESTVTVTDSDRDLFTTRTWESHYTELQRIAPVLLGILDACIPKHSSRRQCIIAGVIAILVKSHGRSTLAHFFTSLVLYSGHAAKQVYSRLQKLGLCLSITSTLKLLDVLGTNHDHIVMGWVKELSKLTTTSHGFITGLPTAQMFNDSVSSTYSSFGVDSLAENLYASTPPSSPSLSEHSFVGNISPITPEVSCVSSDESDDIPSEPNEYPPQSTPVPAGIDNEGNEEWYGFRLVGDNVDKNVKPRDMRLNSQTTSLHYFHTYAVKDRICFSHLSTDPIEIVQDSINFEMFYPTVGDNTELVSNLETLVARMFVQRIPGLQSLSAEATPHIKHLYSKQMALKSEVTLDVCAEGGHTRAVEVKLHNFSYIPLGGDQLTIARIRGSQSILSNSDNGEERLEGFVPVIEDWHTKMCFMEGLEFGHDIAPFLLIDAQVIWKRLYSSCSGMDTGTLFQLRNVINRRNVITDVSKDLIACEEFMQLATIAHVVSAAIHIAGVTNMSELSSKIMSTDKLWQSVQEYAKETLSLGLLLLEFKDGIREGDGNRVLRCWKYFLLFFRATKHKNYCIEAFNLQMQYYYILPKRYAEQMLWGRFINSEGGPGHNIPADLHMEHLNKLLKGTICHLGANKTPQAIIRAGKALGALKYILEEFDRSTGVWVTTNHTTRSEAEDLMKMVTELSQNKVFSHKPGRNHQIFPSIQCNKLLESINQKKLDLWMTQKVGEILKLSPFSH
eukprot:Em0003g952a